MWGLPVCGSSATGLRHRQNSQQYVACAQNSLIGVDNNWNDRLQPVGHDFGELRQAIL
jgi:hypothetical protein